MTMLETIRRIDAQGIRDRLIPLALHSLAAPPPSPGAGGIERPAERPYRRWLRWAGLVAVPVVVAATLFWGGLPGRGRAVAAVVNNDQPVTISGELIPLGRQLAGLLVEGSDDQLSWVLTSAADADRGLKNGDYRAVATVPPAFSRMATEGAANSDASRAAQGVVSIETSRKASVTDGEIARRALGQAATALNAQVVESYLGTVYLGFTTIHSGLGEAVTGADQLADGTRQAKTGAGQLADGSQRLDTGAKQLSDGAHRLADGTTQLSAGAKELAAGLADAQRQTADLPAQTRQLADGARQVADGNQQVASAVTPVANAALVALDALPSFTPSVTELNQLGADCPKLVMPTFCKRLQTAAGTVSTNSTKLTTQRGGVRGKIVELRDGVTRLATGSAQVANGAEQLADGMPKLVTGLGQAATGSRQLADGAVKVDDGAHQLATGADQLSGGSGQLATGAKELRSGLSRIDDGANQLSTGLEDARTQVPTFTDAERTRLARAVATPTLVRASSTGTARLAGSLVLVLALWLGAVALASRSPRQQQVLTSTLPTWRLVLDGARPALVLAAAGGAIAGLATAIYLGLGFGRSLGMVVIAALVAAVFALVNQALSELLGSGGRMLALVAAVVAAAVGITSTSPTLLSSLGRLLPTHAAGSAFRAVTMGGGGLTPAFLGLLAWTLLAAGGTAWAIERRRTVLPRLSPEPVA